MTNRIVMISNPSKKLQRADGNKQLIEITRLCNYQILVHSLSISRAPKQQLRTQPGITR